MGERMEVAKGALEKALEILRVTTSGSVLEGEFSDLSTKIQMARNALVQNKKAIWLRTKMGKEMLDEFRVASTKLLDTVERLQEEEADAALLDDLKTTMVEVELHTKRLNEETHRRSMVVT